MRIVVLVKEVPDTYGDRRLDQETGLTVREGGDNVLDEITERAVELALTRADADAETEVHLLAMAPQGAEASIRKGLAMGAATATQVCDPELAGADALLTAQALAAALRREGFDLIVAGASSTDGGGGVVASLLAELLEIPGLAGLSEVEIHADSVSGARPVDGGVQRVRATLPAIVSVTEALPEARFPNFKGIVAAKKKPLNTVGLAELGVSVNVEEAARSIMLDAAERPARAAGVKITDEGDAGKQLAAFLLENRLA